MIALSVHYISSTFLSILADPSSADFWIKETDVYTPISFKLPFKLNSTVPASTTIGATMVFTTFFLILWQDFGTF